MVRAGIQADQQRALTDATLSGWALGDANFIAGLKAQTPRRLSMGKAGRPFLKPL
jgi:putative transposase